MNTNIYLYKSLVDDIEKILILKKKYNYFYALDIEKDKYFLSRVFLEPIEDKTNYLQWSDNDWVHSMKHIRLGLLSFMYRNNASLKKIYDIVTDQPIYQIMLLEKYKNLINNLKANENILKTQNLIIEENLILDDLDNKKMYLLLNIKNFKDPKNLAYIIDMLMYKAFRQNVIKYILEGINKINIEEILELKTEEPDDFIEDIINFFKEEKLLKKILYFIMLIDIKGDIVSKKKHIQYNKRLYHESLYTFRSIKQLSYKNG